MTTTTFLGGALLAAPFAAAVMTGVAVGVVSIVVADAVGVVGHLKH